MAWGLTCWGVTGEAVDCRWGTCSCVTHCCGIPSSLASQDVLAGSLPVPDAAELHHGWSSTPVSGVAASGCVSGAPVAPAGRSLLRSVDSSTGALPAGSGVLRGLNAGSAEGGLRVLAVAAVHDCWGALCDAAGQVPTAWPHAPGDTAGATSSLGAAAQLRIGQPPFSTQHSRWLTVSHSGHFTASAAVQGVRQYAQRAPIEELSTPGSAICGPDLERARSSAGDRNGQLVTRIDVP